MPPTPIPDNLKDLLVEAERVANVVAAGDAGSGDGREKEARLKVLIAAINAKAAVKHTTTASRMICVQWATFCVFCILALANSALAIAAFVSMGS